MLKHSGFVPLSKYMNSALICCVSHLQSQSDLGDTSKNRWDLLVRPRHVKDFSLEGCAGQRPKIDQKHLLHALKIVKSIWNLHQSIRNTISDAPSGAELFLTLPELGDIENSKFLKFSF